MSNLIRRLRDPAFGAETSERNLMNAAADQIEELLAALLAHEAAQTALNEAEEHSECAEAEGWLNDPTGSCWVSESYNRANKMFEVAAELRLAAIAKATGDPA